MYIRKICIKKYLTLYILQINRRYKIVLSKYKKIEKREKFVAQYLSGKEEAIMYTLRINRNKGYL